MVNSELKDIISDPGREEDTVANQQKMTKNKKKGLHKVLHIEVTIKTKVQIS